MAIMAKINENERAARAMAEMGQTQPQAAFPGHHAPDFEREAAKKKAGRGSGAGVAGEGAGLPGLFQSAFSRNRR